MTASSLAADTSTYSHRRSHEGVTCSGKLRYPSEIRRTIRNVRGSITSTVPGTPLGTYTYWGSPATAGLSSVVAMADHTLSVPPPVGVGVEEGREAVGEAGTVPVPVAGAVGAARATSSPSRVRATTTPPKSRRSAATS